MFSFFHNDHYVLPRRRRYVLTDRGARQYQSVARMAEDILSEKKDNKLRTDNGQGDVYYTNLAAKLLCIVANKAASLDPSGIGIEMEADKPNWYDALNGLPGLLGSSISETLELKRLCLFLLDSLTKVGISKDSFFGVFEELADFLLNIHDILRNESYPLSYWEKSNEAKERYRLSVLQGISGKEKQISVSKVRKLLSSIIAKIDKATKIAEGKRGLLSTYFSHEITHYKKLDAKNAQGFSFVLPLGFEKHALPPFLEGFVHALRAEKSQSKAKGYYQKVKQSELFDKKLKMYRVNGDLSKESSEIGRARIFPAGWLENQSIWLHMEYKFLLELLRRGLYKEFYENLENTLVPFLDPNLYSRSILENSSFIVSSAHEDPKSHGRGYVARLSGSTAEFVHIWLFMNIGLKPFFLSRKKELQLAFNPILEKSLFTTKPTTISFLDKNKKRHQIFLPKNTYAFNFLGSTLTVYHNPKRIDTFDKSKARIKKIILSRLGSKKNIVIDSEIIPSPHAQRVRDGEFSRIDIYF